MEVLEAIKARRSVRKYLESPIAWDHVVHILDAGRLAPSAGNIQNWKFIVCLSQGKRNALAEACLQQYWMQKAPVHICIVSLPERSKKFYGIRGQRLYAVQNCAAAAENMILAATALGLGTCWVGAFDEDMVKRTLKLPDEARPQVILTIGLPDERPSLPQKYHIEGVTYLEGWRGKLRDAWVYFGFTSTLVERKLRETQGKIEELKGHAKGIIEKVKGKIQK